MCGISGIISLNESPVNIKTMVAMNNLVKHRGPDGEGYLLAGKKQGNWRLAEARDASVLDHAKAAEWTAALAHRRLAIIDLTPAGCQPMASADRKLWIVYNGEVYNYLELRQELEAKGYKIRSNTDTEIILTAYQEWGVDCLQRFNGMWSFAILDLNQNILFCARDRVGVKPFYYYCTGSCFLFGSEIKQILAHPDVIRTTNKGVLFDYLVHGYLDHSDQTFYQGIKQLPGGHYLSVPLCSDKNWQPQPIRYWDINLNHKITGWSDQQYADRFLELFEDSIRLRLRSDVPVGSCLSGGLDSSGIVCVMNNLLRKENKEDIQQTFSSCFEDQKYDERRYIDQVAAATKIASHYTFPKGERLVDELDKVLWHQDEPFGSTSIYAQWNVFRLARENGVTVMLDGQGADEILAGYHSYYGAYYASLVRQGKWLRLFNELTSYYRRYQSWPGQKSTFYSAFLSGRMKQQLYLKRAAATKWLTQEFQEEGVKTSPYSQYLKIVDELHQKKGGTYLDWNLYEMFFSTCLPALLHYEDRNAMAFSLEARVPFLDYRLVEFLFSLPDEQKIQQGWTKYIYRNAMRNILPEPIRLRPDKMGFVTPEENWIKNSIKPYCLELCQQVAEQDEVFDKSGLQGAFQGILSGQQGFSFLPWRWINTMLWKRI
ncbi:MAG: asparagine synthase (glutamine-hydrolyzing) [bacterium]|nr:asparagine synthase (glutamine-hydrolyzing) [bacterium]MDD5756169.1 asparagine synthase (glutamine-hydrolyzing) [bacterium]